MYTIAIQTYRDIKEVLSVHIVSISHILVINAAMRMNKIIISFNVTMNFDKILNLVN